MQLFVHLKTIAGVYFARNFYKPLTMLTSSGLCRSTGLSSHLSDLCWLSSLSCFHLLLPSADCLILWTVISSRLVSPVLRCQLLSLSLSLSSLWPSFPPPLPVLQEISSSILCVGFAPKQRDRLRSANISGNELLRIVSHLSLSFFQFSVNLRHNLQLFVGSTRIYRSCDSTKTRCH